MNIGLFGGTFDPVHLGHVEIGKQALEELKLDKLIVIPAKLQPFKLGLPVTSGEHRMEMLRLAFKDLPNIEISDHELCKDEVSYTINTLKAYEKIYPNDQIWFLLGTDSMLKIHLWMESELILRNFHIIVGIRPGYKEKELQQQISLLESKFNTKIHTLRNRKLNISSTEIKERIRQGKRINKLVPVPVERYIVKHALYK